MDCLVCNQNKSKYKCPKCAIQYCSLDCFKVHKNTCIPVNTTAGKDTKEDSTTGKDKQMEQLLESSQELKEMLRKDPILQNYLTTINQADNPYEDLEQLKENGRFAAFVDLINNLLNT
jgi:hypothetical protein